jgi:outer membrane protein, heavy metal efflux system
MKVFLGSFLFVYLISEQLFAHDINHSIDIPEIIQLPRSQMLQLGNVVLAVFNRYPPRLILESQRYETTALQTLAKSWVAGETALTMRTQTDHLGSKRGLQEYELTYELPLWLPAQRAAWRAVAESAQSENETATSALLNVIAGEVREMLWKIAQQEALATLAEHEWDMAILLGNQLQRRVELGEAAKRDILLAQEEILRKQAEFQQAEQELTTLFHQYQALTGLDNLPSNFEETLTLGSEEKLKDDDLSWHPLVQAVQRKLQRVGADLQQVRQSAASPPIVSVGVRREKSEKDENHQDSVGISVRIPFGHQGQQALKLAQAQRNIAENQAELQKILRETRLAIQNAHFTYHYAQEQLKTIELQQKIAKENLRLARLALQHGEMGLIDFQKIQSLAFSADRAVYQRQLARQLAIARYHQALGILPMGVFYE